MDKTIIVFKLPADGSLKAIPEEIPDKLEVLQEYVGGHIEIVTIDRSHDDSRLVMIVNDCGLIRGLPFNPIASIMYQSFTEAETLICGNAIMCSADKEGELQDITPWAGLALLALSKDMLKRMYDTMEDHMTKDELNRRFGDPEGRGLYTDTDTVE